MTRQRFSVDGYWDIQVFYNVAMPGMNKGFTHTDMKRKRSIVAIGMATSREQFLNTVVHEAKHVQSAICKHYGVPEDSEGAAYLIGYLVMRMSRCF